MQLSSDTVENLLAFTWQSHWKYMAMQPYSIDDRCRLFTVLFGNYCMCLTKGKGSTGEVA